MKTSKARTTASTAAARAKRRPAAAARRTREKKNAASPTSKLTEMLPRMMQDGYEAVVSAVEGAFSGEPKDIVDAIRKDHDGLREFIDILKDPHRELAERRRAYAQFSALLKSHTLAEERVVYATASKLPDAELRIKVAEGYVEHQVASDVMARMERSRDPKSWGAHANVLAELVEHHLKEEEEDLLPRLRKDASAPLDEKMLNRFLGERAATQKRVTERNAGVLKH